MHSYCHITREETAVAHRQLTTDTILPDTLPKVNGAARRPTLHRWKGLSRRESKPCPAVKGPKIESRKHPDSIVVQLCATRTEI